MKLEINCRGPFKDTEDLEADCQWDQVCVLFHVFINYPELRDKTTKIFLG